MSVARPTRDLTRLLIRFNALISELTRSGRNGEALQLFARLHSSHQLTPDQFSLSSTLTAAATLRATSAGAQLHSYAIRSGLYSVSHVANSLLSFYAKSQAPELALLVFDEIPDPDSYSCTTLLSAYTKVGRVRDALQLFAEMPNRDAAVWNALITGCVENGLGDQALELFVTMHFSGVRHDHYSYASVLSLCTSPELLRVGRHVHAMVITTGFVMIRDSVVCALITMYFSCGVAVEACDVFGEASIRDCVMYNAVIAGLMDLGRDVDAMFIFKEMISEAGFRPNELTLLSALGACSSDGPGKQVHTLAVKTGLGYSTLVGNALVTMYSSSGDLINSCLVFNSIDIKDIVSWNSMISGHSQHGCFESAAKVYFQMRRAGIDPDAFTMGSLLGSSSVSVHAEMILALAVKNGLINSTQVCNALISAFAKFGEMQSACRIFSKMPSRNLISWNSIMSGCVLNDMSMESLELFSALAKSELTPELYSLSMVLTTCASISSLGHGKQLHAYIVRSGFDSEPSLENALITMYAKCGILDWSARVFRRMYRRDVVSWNAMLAAYMQHGDGKEAIHCFKEMQDSGLEPDQVTFIIILSACSHSGFIDEGCQIFSSMINDYGIEPGVDHYSCIIDLLGRSGRLDEVERIIHILPHKLDCRIWWALLSACSVYGNARLGRIAAEFLLEMEPCNPAVYVLLSNVYAAAGQWEEACNVRKQMKKSGVKKNPAYSWIESRNHLTTLNNS